MDGIIKALLANFQVRIPFKRLCGHYLDYFIENRLNPEITFDADDLDLFSVSDFNRIAKQLLHHDLKVTFHAPYKDLTPASSDPMVRAVALNRFEQLIRLIPIFRPWTVVCHTGYDAPRYDMPRDDWLEHSPNVWTYLGGRISEFGGKLMLENVYERDPQDLKDLFNRLDACQIEFCLDVGHVSAFSDTALENWLKVMGPYIGQLHLHDNAHHHDEHLPLGKGMLSLNLIMNFLNWSKTESIFITLEPYEDLESWIVNSIEYLNWFRNS